MLRGGQEPGPSCKLIWDPPGEGLLSAGAASIVPLAGGEGLEEKELWAETPRKHGESLEPPSFSLDQRVLFGFQGPVQFYLLILNSASF